jgi:hypothetical protein
MCCLIIPIIFTLICVSSTYGGDKMGGGRFVGGQCEYKEYEGRAEIISITRIARSIHDPYEREEVKFKFIPYREIQESFARTEGREFFLMLSNSSYPGPKFLERYGIDVGKVFDCHLKVISQGTCTPTIFEFPSIRLDDYSVN